MRDALDELLVAGRLAGLGSAVERWWVLAPTLQPTFEGREYLDATAVVCSPARDRAVKLTPLEPDTGEVFVFAWDGLAFDEVCLKTRRDHRQLIEGAVLEYEREWPRHRANVGKRGKVAGAAIEPPLSLLGVCQTDPRVLIEGALFSSLVYDQHGWLAQFANAESVTIPWPFAAQIVGHWSWPQVRYGLSRGLCGADFVVANAKRLVSEGDELSSAVLATESSLEVGRLVDRLAGNSTPVEQERAPWIPVAMEWVRCGNPAPGWWPLPDTDAVAGAAGRLAALESVWSTLDYPEEVGFVAPPQPNLSPCAKLLPSWVQRQRVGEAVAERWDYVDTQLRAWVQAERIRLAGR